MFNHHILICALVCIAINESLLATITIVPPSPDIISDQSILDAVDSLNTTNITTSFNQTSTATITNRIRRQTPTDSAVIPCNEIEPFSNLMPNNYEVFLKDDGKSFLLKKQIKLQRIVCQVENSSCFRCNVNGPRCHTIPGQYRIFAYVQFQANGNFTVTNKRVEQLGVGCKCQQQPQ